MTARFCRHQCVECVFFLTLHHNVCSALSCAIAGATFDVRGGECAASWIASGGAASARPIVSASTAVITIGFNMRQNLAAAAACCAFSRVHKIFS